MAPPSAKKAHCLRFLCSHMHKKQHSDDGIKTDLFYSCTYFEHSCFGACRINHLLRYLPFQHARLLAEKSSVFVRNASAEILGLPLPDVCFLLACLSVRKDGLGTATPHWCSDPRWSRQTLLLRAPKANVVRRWTSLLRWTLAWCTLCNLQS